jgi:hypothetical protein
MPAMYPDFNVPKCATLQEAYDVLDKAKKLGMYVEDAKNLAFDIGFPKLFHAEKKRLAEVAASSGWSSTVSTMKVCQWIKPSEAMPIDEQVVLVKLYNDPQLEIQQYRIGEGNVEFSTALYWSTKVERWFGVPPIEDGF